jgi:hypothetical protein
VTIAHKHVVGCRRQPARPGDHRIELRDATVKIPHLGLGQGDPLRERAASRSTASCAMT